MSLGSHAGSIVAIPAVGADPEKTWKYPNSHDRDPEYLWSEIKDARIYLYEFSQPAPGPGGDITSYAVEMLQVLDHMDDRPLHIAAHG